jgi:hypothetical protein
MPQTQGQSWSLTGWEGTHKGKVGRWLAGRDTQAEHCKISHRDEERTSGGGEGRRRQARTTVPRRWLYMSSASSKDAKGRSTAMQMRGDGGDTPKAVTSALQQQKRSKHANPATSDGGGGGAGKGVCPAGSCVSWCTHLNNSTRELSRRVLSTPVTRPRTAGPGSAGPAPCVLMTKCSVASEQAWAMLSESMWHAV